MKGRSRESDFPYWLRAIIFGWLGWYGIVTFTKGIESIETMFNTFYLMSIGGFAAVFSYGVICLIEDYRKGGIHNIIKRIKNFF